MTTVNEIMEEALKSVRPENQKPAEAANPDQKLVKKRTLAELMSALEEMESVFDDIGEITKDMVQEHFDAYTAVDVKTDKIIGFMERQQMEATRAAGWYELWKVKEKKHLSALERTKDYCKWLLTTYPNLEYRGTHARLVLQRVQPKLTITTPQYRFSSERVIPDDHVSAIPEHLRKVNLVWVYNTEAIREALKKGEDTPIARLDENYSVRIKL